MLDEESRATRIQDGSPASVGFFLVVPGLVINATKQGREADRQAVSTEDVPIYGVHAGHEEPNRDLECIILDASCGEDTGK